MRSIRSLPPSWGGLGRGWPHTPPSRLTPLPNPPPTRGGSSLVTGNTIAQKQRPSSPRAGQREPDAAADHDPARGARQKPRPPRREERPHAPGRQRISAIRETCENHEGDAEQRHLREMIPAHVDELRNEGAEEHQQFGV